MLRNHKIWNCDIINTATTGIFETSTLIRGQDHQDRQTLAGKQTVSKKGMTHMGSYASPVPVLARWPASENRGAKLKKQQSARAQTRAQMRTRQRLLETYATNQGSIPFSMASEKESPSLEAAQKLGPMPVPTSTGMPPYSLRDIRWKS